MFKEIKDNLGNIVRVLETAKRDMTGMKKIEFIGKKNKIINIKKSEERFDSRLHMTKKRISETGLDLK